MFNNFVNHLSIVTGYTIIWHGLYYCTPISNNFNKIILYLHGNLIKKD